MPDPGARLQCSFIFCMQIADDKSLHLFEPDKQLIWTTLHLLKPLWTVLDIFGLLRDVVQKNGLFMFRLAIKVNHPSILRDIGAPKPPNQKMWKDVRHYPLIRQHCISISKTLRSDLSVEKKGWSLQRPCSAAHLANLPCNICKIQYVICAIWNIQYAIWNMLYVNIPISLKQSLLGARAS